MLGRKTFIISVIAEPIPTPDNVGPRLLIESVKRA